ncbi:MAG: TolC family protein [Treponema sp.]|jgi:outer membrane protein TolC|nr:TolC family protein [Treponema sp.]
MTRLFVALFFLCIKIFFLFGDEAPPLSFAAAADLAVAASDELHGEYAMKAIREGAWVLGLRAYLPKISLAVSEDDRLAEISADSFLKNYSINADQLLWDGGRTAMSRRLEKMDLTLAGARLERMAQDIAESAVASYRNVLSARAVVGIREAALVSLSEQRRILEQETDLGLALPIDLAEAELTLSLARLELLSLRIDLAEAERQFAEILKLDEMPLLAEQVDINRETFLPSPAAARSLAVFRNPDLTEARFAVIQKEGELKYASRSWIPTLRLTGSFGLNGQRYPLTRQNWSVGLSVEFASPWFTNTFNAGAGLEPPYDKTARVQNSFTPLPDPASGLDKHRAELALSLERTRLGMALERIGRSAAAAVEKCGLAEEKRQAAVEALALGAERRRIEELRLELGQITRIELMEDMIEYTQKEISAVEAAVALLEAERAVEKILDLRPGELAAFAASDNEIGQWSGL